VYPKKINRCTRMATGAKKCNHLNYPPSWINVYCVCLIAPFNEKIQCLGQIVSTAYPTYTVQISHPLGCEIWLQASYNTIPVVANLLHLLIFFECISLSEWSVIQEWWIDYWSSKYKLEQVSYGIKSFRKSCPFWLILFAVFIVF